MLWQVWRSFQCIYFFIEWIKWQGLGGGVCCEVKDFCGFATKPSPLKARLDPPIWPPYEWLHGEMLQTIQHTYCRLQCDQKLHGGLLQLLFGHTTPNYNTMFMVFSGTCVIVSLTLFEAHVGLR